MYTAMETAEILPIFRFVAGFCSSFSKRRDAAGLSTSLRLKFLSISLISELKLILPLFNLMTLIVNSRTRSQWFLH